MIGLFIKTWKEAYKKTYADRIKAKKHIEFFKKEIKRMSEYHKKITILTDVLVNEDYLFPQHGKPYFEDYRGFTFYIAYRDEENYHNPYYIFNVLEEKARDCYRRSRAAYKHNDYEWVQKLYDQYINVLKNFDEVNGTFIMKKLSKV